MSKKHKGGTAVIAAVLLTASLLVMGCDDSLDNGFDEPDTKQLTPSRVATPTVYLEMGFVGMGKHFFIITETKGATIRYTTDGTTPTASTGTQYAAPFEPPSLPITVKAIAVKTDMKDSRVRTVTYGLDGTLDPLNSDPDFDIPDSGSDSDGTGSDSDSTGSDSDGTGSDSAGPSSDSDSTGSDSAGPGSDSAGPSSDSDGLMQVATPTASPGAGAVSPGQIITLVTATDGATIRYTTDGSDPTGSSTIYTDPIRLTGSSATVKAIAVRSGMTESEVLTAAYTLSYSFTTPEAQRTMVSLNGGTVTATSGSYVFNSFREVVLEPFAIAKYETTYQLWKEVYDWAEANGYTIASPGVEGQGTGDGTDAVGTAAARATRPVTTINWRDAVVWCNAYSELSGKTPVYYTDNTYTTVLKVSTTTSGTETVADGAKMKPDANGYRLPREAEWEYAARGGIQSDTENWNYIYAGSDSINIVGWYEVNSYFRVGTGDYGVHPVGSLRRNAADLYDMSGNVEEWCWDWYGDFFVTASTPVDGAASGDSRIYRGGSWLGYAAALESTFRNRNTPTTRTNFIGFRVACR